MPETCPALRPHGRRLRLRFPVNRLAQALKFHEQLNLANALADRVAARVEIRPDAIVPMPLHPARLRERGFNQSLELARRLSARLELPLHARACQRVRDTPPQAALRWKERGKNVRKAFTCSEDFSGKHVAMVDDVMTSGATLNELARALRRAGAREVSAWVVARNVAARSLMVCPGVSGSSGASGLPQLLQALRHETLQLGAQAARLEGALERVARLVGAL